MKDAVRIQEPQRRFDYLQQAREEDWAFQHSSNRWAAGAWGRTGIQVKIDREIEAIEGEKKVFRSR